MKPWRSSYPADFVAVHDDGSIDFDVHLGWGLIFRRNIAIEFSVRFDPTQRIFIKRRLENIMGTAKHIFIDMTWDDSGDFCEILINGEDLTDVLTTSGVLPKE
jgi:hypothetical protein